MPAPYTLPDDPDVIEVTIDDDDAIEIPQEMTA